MGFGSVRLADLGEVPERVTLLCGGKQVADLPCRLWGSIPLDEAPPPDSTIESCASWHASPLSLPSVSVLI